ncbi:MAG: ROK family transcriptional regulator [Anaerolineales bacterium]|nr:ROK family transcriptional regulator [Anaerolineales bacterium]
MAKHPRGNRKLIRAINRSSVLYSIMRFGPISRTDVAERTGLSAATISGITAELIESDIIFEKEAGDSSGGRKPILLSINPQGGYVVGLKLAEDNITAALLDLEANLIETYTDKFENHTTDDAIHSLNNVISDLLQIGEIRKEQLIGVGVGLAGIVDAETGVLQHSPIFGWHDFDLKNSLQDKLEVPVYLDNDVNTLTLTEKWFGAGQGVDHFLTVTIGRGVGLGIVIDGQLYHGSHGGAGEFGHTVINPEGVVCDCGKRGCLETIVSDPSLMRSAADAYAAGRSNEEVSDIEELVKLGQEGHPVVTEIFDQAADALAQGLANLINVLCPQLIIISGEGIRAGDLIFDPMFAALPTYVMPGLSEHVELRIDDWEDHAWARGAAGIVLRDFFESPIHRKVPVSQI